LGTNYFTGTLSKTTGLVPIFCSSAFVLGSIATLITGHIGAAVGLKETVTGDTLCDPAHPVVLESIYAPDPVISVAIEPKTKADEQKMGTKPVVLLNVPVK